MIGKTLWKYKITEFLGSGGSAKVWKGYDERTKREVAIKVLPEDFDPSLLTRLRNETRAISQIDHPNVIKILDIGTEAKLNYYVMEYVKGRTLKELIHERYEIEKSSLTHQEVVGISMDIARALEHIHGRRIYHRDIKPGNILVTDAGRSILMDFGLVKLHDETTVSTAGSIVGTPLYMSPEQLQGQEVDHRSDIYQLGIVMYKMATGKVPFEGDNSYSAAARRLTEKIPVPSRYNPRVSPQIERIILKCTQRDRGQRYATTAELTCDLQAALDNREVTVELKPQAPGETSLEAKSAAGSESAKTGSNKGPSIDRFSNLKIKVSLAANVLFALGLLGMWMGPGTKKTELSLSPRKVNVGVAQAMITFGTNIPVRSEVAYGAGDDLSQLRLISAEPTTDHRVTLHGLDPATEYRYVLRFILDGKRLVTYRIEAFKTNGREEHLAGQPSSPSSMEPVTSLIEELRAGDYKVRLSAVRKLDRIGSVRAYEPLIPLLKDRNNEVREAACQALGRLVKKIE